MTRDTPQKTQPEVVRDIREFLLGAEALPSPQGTALKLVEIAQAPNASIDDVVRIVKTDPALTGFVLQAAASARFHDMKGVLDLHRAVQRLGLSVIRSHALALSLISRRMTLRCAGFDYERFWVGALHTAILTEALAQECNIRTAIDTFSLGLLADIGRLAFATAAPDEYARVLMAAQAAPDDLSALERQAFGFDHHELSSVLLADWQLPTAMADLVYWQSDPEGGGFAAGSAAYQLVSVLQLARSLSDQTLNCTHGPNADALSSATLRAAILALDRSDMETALAGSVNALRAWTTLVGLPMPMFAKDNGAR